MWLCIRFPRLLLDQPLAADERQSGPQALLAQHHIEEVNREAFAAGVRVGQSLASARTLCPALQCRAANPERMTERLNQLALWAYRFTPEVSIAQPDSLLLELSGSLKLFDGFEKIFKRLRWGFRKRRIPTCYGLAHTPLAASLLSFDDTAPETLLTPDGQLNQRAVTTLLNSQPCHRLPCDLRQKEQLLTLGLNTLGEVHQLPRTALSRRLGKDFSLMLEKLYGQQPDPRPYYQPPDKFFSERQFNGELNRSEELRFPAAGLLDELGHYLQLKQWVCRELHWQFYYCDGQHSELHMPVSHTHFDRRALLALVLLQLEKFELSGPVDSLALRCNHFDAVQQHSNDLFPHSSPFDHERHTRYVAVLDKLRARLGTAALQQPALHSAHLPEQAAIHPPPTSKTTGQTTADRSTETRRPLWLLEKPLRLQEKNGQPCWQGTLEILQGPERLDNQWWRQRHARDYYIARTCKHSLCWIFRDCLHQHWYLHGWFG